MRSIPHWLLAVALALAPAVRAEEGPPAPAAEIAPLPVQEVATGVFVYAAPYALAMIAISLPLTWLLFLQSRRLAGQ